MGPQLPLPSFKYHPDPLATGSVEANPDAPCLCCNRIRGYIYLGPAYSEIFHNLSGAICPWCIADGSAAKRFKAEFTDTGLIDDVSDSALDDLARRTPGFTAWQQEQWLTCCEDAAAFLGRAGAAELNKDFAPAKPALKKWLKENCDLTGTDRDNYIAALQKDGEASAYVFRCLHCSAYLAYSDEA